MTPAGPANAATEGEPELQSLTAWPGRSRRRTNGGRYRLGAREDGPGQNPCAVGLVLAGLAAGQRRWSARVSATGCYRRRQEV